MIHISFIKHNVLDPAHVIEVIDSHVQVLNVSGLELISKLTKLIGIDMMYERTSLQNYRKYVALGLFVKLVELGRNNPFTITESHVSLPLVNVLRSNFYLYYLQIFDIVTLIYIIYKY